MEIRAEITYSAADIQLAVRRFWWRTAGWKMLASVALTLSCLVMLLIAGDRSWLVGALGTVSAMGIAFLVLLYVVRYRHGISRLVAMGSPTALFSASQDSLAISSGAGTAKLNWPAFLAIWKFPEVWLLLVSRNQYITLPVDRVAPEFLDFVQERVLNRQGADTLGRPRRPTC